MHHFRSEASRDPNWQPEAVAASRPTWAPAPQSPARTRSISTSSKKYNKMTCLILTPQTSQKLLTSEQCQLGLPISSKSIVTSSILEELEVSSSQPTEAQVPKCKVPASACPSKQKAKAKAWWTMHQWKAQHCLTSMMGQVSLRKSAHFLKSWAEQVASRSLLNRIRTPKRANSRIVVEAISSTSIWERVEQVPPYRLKTLRPHR